jgi:hypothetical protein
MLAAGVLAAVLAGCGGPSETEPDGAPEEGESTTRRGGEAGEQSTEAPGPPPDSRIVEVPIDQWRAMQAAGMIRPECPVQERSQLRRVELNHVDFNGDVKRGHLIVRDDTARTAKRIFDRLFEMEFPIRRMVGVEAYGGDVNASLRADNTSAFNCRKPDQINAPFTASPHANGRAIDVNPRENPWMDLRCDCWSPGPKHAKRTPGPGKILRGDPVWQTFIDEGWIWQNIDVADYMHFDTGYPSTPYEPARS